EVLYSNRRTVTGEVGTLGSGQLVEQRLRLDEVTRVEAFGEPGVDGRQQRPSLGRTVLVAQQPREARRGAQLERAGALLAGDGKGAVIAGGGLIGGTATREKKVTIEPVEVGVELRLARLRGHGERHRHSPLRLDELAGGLLGFGQNREARGN